MRAQMVPTACTRHRATRQACRYDPLLLAAASLRTCMCLKASQSSVKGSFLHSRPSATASSRPTGALSTTLMRSSPPFAPSSPPTSSPASTKVRCFNFSSKTALPPLQSSTPALSLATPMSPYSPFSPPILTLHPPLPNPGACSPG